MAANSAIEWTDHTFNPWIGCTKVGPGCEHCYAEILAAARLAVPWGPGAPRRRTATSTWQQPRRWDRNAAAAGIRQRVFCASLADVFDNEVSPEWRTDLFELIRATPNLDWLLVTKRIGNAQRLAEAAGGWPENVWLGATIVDQAEADRDIPKLLRIVGPRFRFLSMEPLLAPVDLKHIRNAAEAGGPLNALTGYQALTPAGGQGVGYYFAQDDEPVPRLDWIIVGGESGKDARPMHPAWPRLIRDQCEAAGVPFLFKQWGEWGRASVAPSGTAGRYAIATTELSGAYPTRVFPVDSYPRQFDLFGGASVMQWLGKKAAGRQLDGRAHDGTPTPR